MGFTCLGPLHGRSPECNPGPDRTRRELHVPLLGVPTRHALLPLPHGYVIALSYKLIDTRLALVDALATSASFSAAPLLLLALDHRAWRSACSGAVQGARGLEGPIAIERAGGPYARMYDEERVLFLSDEWRDPSVCLKVEGAMPGNDVCADIRHASFNGIFGNGSDAFSFPLVPVEAG